MVGPREDQAGISTEATLDGALAVAGVEAGAAAAETNTASLGARKHDESSHSALDNERGSRYTGSHSRGHLSLELL